MYGVRLKVIMWVKEVIIMAKDEKIRKVFADNLKSFFIQKGVTQKELAKYMGVSAPTVNDWIKGRVLPRMDKIDKLCVYFNVMRSDFLEVASTPAPPPNAIPLTDKDKAVAYAYHAAPADKQRIVDVTLGLDGEGKASSEAWTPGDVDDYQAALREETMQTSPTSSNTAELIGKKILAASTEAQLAVNEIIENDNAVND